MRSYTLLLLSAASALLLCCTKPDDSTPDKPQPEEESITLSTPALHPVIPSEGGSATIAFTATAPWTAAAINTRADSWIAVTPASGAAGNASVTVTATDNDTYEERNATVRIACGKATAEVVVTQKQLDNLTVTTDKVELTEEGGTFTITLKANIDYGYEVSGDWIHPIQTKAYSEGSLAFSADPNGDIRKREGSVTVIGGQFSETVHVYQNGEEPSIVLTQDEYSVDAEGGEVSVEVVANVPVTMTVPEDAAWIREDRTRSSSTSTFRLEIDANGEYEQRTARLAFSSAETDIADTVTIIQAGRTFIHADSVTLNVTEKTMTEGDSITLNATVLPEDATDKNVHWNSSDINVATVDADGKVSAVKAGTATITVTTEDGGKTAQCTVTVKEKIYAVEGVSLDKTSLELTEGDRSTLTATIKPDNATNRNVTWKSSDEGVATVSDGVVTAVKAGTATITVTTEDGGKTAQCTVTVKEKIYAVEGVSLDKTSLQLTEGDRSTLTATVKPDNATNRNVTWKSSDEGVATVSDGVVTAVKAGTATITVTTEDGGKTAQCTVTVKEKIYAVEGVSLDKTSLELTEGDRSTLTATVKPDNATNRNVTWKSSDEGVATVAGGVVTAVKAGTATITVTTEDGGKTAQCAVTVLSNSTPGDNEDLTYEDL